MYLELYYFNAQTQFHIRWLYQGMKTLVVLALVATFAYAYDPVFVDELEDIVLNKQDEIELDRLDDDKNMLRSEKKKKLEEILSRQPENIQQLFAKEVEREKLKHQAKFERKMARATDPAVKDYLQQVEVIGSDMNISDGDAKRKIKELKSKLTDSQLRELKKLD
ncbi:unnamed protein product [Cylicocyclus nassatus]|uniref:Uncharacterized protein n=1 Tax=Cylicocyclus nassatus TaxID=53992 RepID=A0AA36HEG8_CYLNA|nr:unnamed protein product [Cylicocyclus nassatus]